MGAISVDNQGNVASGVSSGGLILKQEGRVGQVFKKSNLKLNILLLLILNKIKLNVHLFWFYIFNVVGFNHWSWLLGTRKCLHYY